MDTEDETSGHGGAREGAGRPKGKPSLRRAAQAIAEVEEAFPGWSPVLHLAAVANDESLPPDIRLDAAKAAAPYFHSRPKPVEMEPDALVELERRLIAAKIEAAATVLENPSLAERLARAKARITVRSGLDFGCDGAVAVSLDDDDGRVIDATPEPPRQPRPTMFEPSVQAPPELDPVPRYSPILPRSAAADRPAPMALWPNRNEGRVQVEYDPTHGSYDLP